MSEDLPLITIVTAVFNGDRYLQGCIDSVACQTYKRVEHIVIDGGSTDQTVEIIKENIDSLTFWVSEKDSGIAEAMNKGVRHSSGDYILFVHADDYLVSSNALEEVARYLVLGVEILLADILYGKQLVRKSSRGLNFWMNVKTGVCHQGVLCHKSVFTKIGKFDESLKIAMDYDFFLRAYRLGVRAVKCHRVLTVMRDTGVSSKATWDSLAHRFSEERLVHSKNLGNSKLLLALYIFYWPSYFSYRKVLFFLLRGR